MKTTFFGVAAGATLAILAGCSSGTSGGGVLLSVNGENVSREQLMDYLAKKPTVRVSTQNGIVEASVSEPLDYQALQDMIGQKIVLQLAKDEGVFPTDSDVTAELEFRKRINPNYVKELTANGIDFDVIKDNLALELARENLLIKGITVTKEETEKYIKDNPEQFTEPAKVELYWVFVKTKTKQARIDQEISSGQSFEAIARQFTDYANPNGGDPIKFPQTVVESLRPELKKLVDTTAEGKITDWLALSDGFARFYVNKKVRAKKMDLNDDRKELVRRSIARGRGEQATDLARKVLKKIKDSQIKVNDKTLQGAWDRAYERLKKESGESASSNSSAAPPSTEK